MFFFEAASEKRHFEDQRIEVNFHDQIMKRAFKGLSIFLHQKIPSVKVKASASTFFLSHSLSLEPSPSPFLLLSIHTLLLTCYLAPSSTLALALALSLSFPLTCSLKHARTRTHIIVCSSLYSVSFFYLLHLGSRLSVKALLPIKPFNFVIWLISGKRHNSSSSLEGKVDPSEETVQKMLRR